MLQNMIILEKKVRNLKIILMTNNIQYWHMWKTKPQTKPIVLF